MALVLIGFMGAGKSTVAAALAEELGVKALDSDALLEQQFGHSLAREFELVGEQAFRVSEEELVCRLLEGGSADEVIALGGGSVLSERVREALTNHVTVLLDIDPDTAWERVQPNPDTPSPDTPTAPERPLAADRASFAALHAERRGLYEGLADAILPEGTSLASARRALDALRALEGAPIGTRMVWASSSSGEYPVVIGRGLLSGEDDAAIAALWPLERASSRAFCISDETVAPLYGTRLGELLGTVAIAPGEQHKTLASAEGVWQAMLAAGITRADHIVALGGGVVGDLAGFCAATYQRGIPVVQVPTTLVAQVDSAFGGKTGVDLPQAKNYIGVYHQPAGVIVDPEVLGTLPPEEYAAGWVEVLKTALIAGGELWEHVVAGGEVDEQTIFACIRTKLAVVAADERDGGRRQVLNLGHTIGHAIETVSGYARYRHGEAVGLGLLAALRLSGQDELRERVRELLAERGLPIQVDGLSLDEILAALAHDKKRVGATVPFVLVKAPGEVLHGCDVAEAEVRGAIAESSK